MALPRGRDLTLIAVAVALSVATSAAAAEGDGTELSLAVHAAYVDATSPAPAPARSSGTSFDATLAGTIYGRLLVDDATPRDLQPFLQRASHLTLWLRGGAVTEPLGGAPSSTLRSPGLVGIGVEEQLYVAPSLVLIAAGAALAYDAGDGARRQEIPYRFGAALRLGDLELAASLEGRYARDPDRAASTGLDAHARLDLRAVFVEHIDLRLGVAFSGSSFAALIDATYYPTTTSGRLGLRAGGWGGGFGGDVPAHDTFALGLHVGASLWLTRVVALALDYTPTWRSAGSGAVLDDGATLSLVGRGP